MLEELTSLVSQYGLWIVFFGMMTEGTIMILVSGVLCYLGMLSLEETIPVAIFGALMGDQFWYFIGRYYGQNILKRFPLLEQRVKKLEHSVKKRGIWLAFSGRFIYSGAILFPVKLGRADYDLPAQVDISQRLNRAYAQQLPFLINSLGDNID